MSEGKQPPNRNASAEDGHPSSTGAASYPATYAATTPSITVTAPLSIHRPPSEQFAGPPSRMQVSWRAVPQPNSFRELIYRAEIFRRNAYGNLWTTGPMPVPSAPTPAPFISPASRAGHVAQTVGQVVPAEGSSSTVSIGDSGLKAGLGLNTSSSTAPSVAQISDQGLGSNVHVHHDNSSIVVSSDLSVSQYGSGSIVSSSAPPTESVGDNTGLNTQVSSVGTSNSDLVNPHALGSRTEAHVSSAPNNSASMNHGQALGPLASPEGSSSTSLSSRTSTHLGSGFFDIIGRLYSESLSPNHATRPLSPIEDSSETDSSGSDTPRAGFVPTASIRQSVSAVPHRVSSAGWFQYYDPPPPYEEGEFFGPDHDPRPQLGEVEGQNSNQPVRENLSDNPYTTSQHVPQLQTRAISSGSNPLNQASNFEESVRTPRAGFRSSGSPGRLRFRTPPPIPRPPKRPGSV